MISPDNVFALDGSKIEAHAGYSMTRSKGEWEDRRQQILKHVEKYLNECEEQDKLEEDAEEEQRDRFNRIQEKLNSIKSTNSKDTSNKKTDPDKAVEKGKSSDDSSDKESEELTSKKKNRIKVEDCSGAEKYLDEYEKIETLLEKYETADNKMLLNLSDPDCRIMKSDGITKEWL